MAGPGDTRPCTNEVSDEMTGPAIAIGDAGGRCSCCRGQLSSVSEDRRWTRWTVSTRGSVQGVPDPALWQRKHSKHLNVRCGLAGSATDLVQFRCSAVLLASPIAQIMDHRALVSGSNRRQEQQEQQISPDHAAHERVRRLTVRRSWLSLSFQSTRWTCPDEQARHFAARSDGYNTDASADSRMSSLA